MIRKEDEENLDIEVGEGEVGETEVEKTEVEKTEIKKNETEEIYKKESVSTGNPYTVYRNEGSVLFLIDAKGNGFKVPTPTKYKNAKKGDIIYT